MSLNWFLVKHLQAWRIFLRLYLITNALTNLTSLSFEFVHKITILVSLEFPDIQFWNVSDFGHLNVANLECNQMTVCLFVCAVSPQFYIILRKLVFVVEHHLELLSFPDNVTIARWNHSVWIWKKSLCIYQSKIHWIRKPRENKRKSILCKNCKTKAVL